MIETDQCSACGTRLPAEGAPERLCPRCLFAVAASESEDATDAELLESLVGRTVDGKYRIDRRLGYGGMGAVFLATHVGTERAVALKVLAPHLMDDEEFVERFRREAKAAGRLRHPNIVNVTDFGFADVGDDEVLAYLVMEYLDGSSLADYVACHADLSLAWIGDVVEQIASAVDEAHRRGVIHRDLKPANIWLVPDGRGGHHVKVLDFGLAKLRAATVSVEPSSPVATADEAPTLAMPEVEPVRRVRRFGAWRSAARITGVRRGAAPLPGDPPSEADAITRVGSIMGTPLYMSPEQCRGEKIDGASDIYSLGVITYELLTGERPFTGDVEAVVVQHMERAPSRPSTVRGAIPQSIDGAVLPALAKRSTDRPATAGAFARSLQAALRAAGEDSVSIFGQAFALYGRNFWTFLRLSPVSGVLPCASGVGLGLLFAWSSLDWIGMLVLVALAVAGLLVGGVVNAGILTPLVARALETPDSPMPALGDVRVRWSALPVFVAATLWPSGGLWRFALAIFFMVMQTAASSPSVQSASWPVRFVLMAGMMGVSTLSLSLTGSVAMLEGRTLRETLDRAKTLSRRAGEVYRSTFSAGEAFVGLLTASLILMAFVVPTSRPIVDALVEGSPDLVSVISGVAVAGVMWPGLILLVVAAAIAGVALNPIVGICYALKYLKARQLGGETLDDVLTRVDAGPVRLRESGGLQTEVALRPSRTYRAAGVAMTASALLFAGVAVATRGLSTSTFGAPYAIFGVFLVWYAYTYRRMFHMFVNDDGIGYRGTLVGASELRWSEVASVTLSGGTIAVRGANATMRIAPRQFERSDEVREYVMRQLRRHGKIQ